MSEPRTRVSGLQVLDTKLTATQADIADIKRAMVGMQDAFVKLAGIEVEHVNTKAAIARAFAEVNRLQEAMHQFEQRAADRSTSKDEQLHAIERSIPDGLGTKLDGLDKRLHDLEIEAPGWREMRKYIVTGVILMVGMVFAALLTVVVKTPSVFGSGSTIYVPQPERPEQTPGFKRPIWRMEYASALGGSGACITRASKHGITPPAGDVQTSSLGACSGNGR